MSDRRELLTDQPFWIVAGAGGVALFALLLFTTFGYELRLPKSPARPKTSVASAERWSEGVDRNPAAWAKYLEMDARAYGAPKTSPEEMKRAFEYRASSRESMLVPGDDAESTVEVAGLRLHVSVQDIKGRTKRMLVLQIENTTDTPLAYKVDTRPSRGTSSCPQKDELVHNAMAIAPGDVETRSECIYRSGWKLKIKSVETMALPELAFHYVSRLPPPQVGYERRVAEGHKPPRGELCSLILPGSIASGIESGALKWRDLVDFYARHRCETYTFPDSYKHFERDGERELPAAGARR
jgi:hypothetical protein